MMERKKKQRDSTTSSSPSSVGDQDQSRKRNKSKPTKPRHTPSTVPALGAVEEESDDAKMRLLGGEHGAGISDEAIAAFINAQSHADVELGSMNMTVLSSQQTQPRRVKHLIEHEISGDFYHVYNSDTTFEQEQPHPPRSGRGHDHKLLSRAASTISIIRHAHLKPLKPPKALSVETIEEEDESQGVTWAAVSARALPLLETAMTIMCQGILAGLCWTDAFNLSATDSLLNVASQSTFVCTYTAVADRSRQLLFILIKYPPIPRLAVYVGSLHPALDTTS